MPYPQPGQTFRLSPPWTEGDSWGFFGFHWSSIVPGQLSATSNFPEGWVANIVSGSFGSPDLVVDVISPDLQGSFSEGSGLYDVCAQFSHGQYGSPTYFHRFGFSYAELTSPNLPKFDIVLHPVSHVLFSALLEPEGIRLYSSNLRDGFSNVTMLDALIERADSPQLWIDAHGHIYMVALQRDTPCGPRIWRLWRSLDSGTTLDDVSTLPFDASFGHVRASGGFSGVIMAYAPLIENGQDGTGHISRSFDYGATWEDPWPMTTIYGGTFTSIKPIPDTNYWHATATGVGANLMRSADLGHSWDLLPYNFVAPSPYGLAYNSPAHIVGRNIWGQAARMSQFNNTYPELRSKLVFSRSHDRGLTWLPPTLIADDPTDNMTALGQALSTNTLFMTNGRDRIYLSSDSGATWAEPVAA